jgi:hypothetical protein
MMLKYGPTLSNEAYSKAVDELYAEVVDARPTPDILRKELELTIDNRLGVYFPRERRNHIWLVQERINARYANFGKWQARMYWLISFVRPQILQAKIAELSEFTMSELESAFTKEELAAFAGFQH